MSNETLLYICGIVLAVSAVGVSFIGLKVKGFPGKAMPIVVIWFAIFVGGATTFAVLHAKDEDADRAKEAKFEEANEKAEEEGGHVGPESSEGVEGNEEEKEEEAEENAEGLEEEGEVGPEEGEPGAEEQEPQVEKEEAGGEEASGDAEAGAEVFASNCAACHGEDGHGGAGGPDLTTMPKAQEQATAEEQVREGGGGMPPFEGQLSDEEISNVAAFVVQKVVGAG